MKSPKSNFVFSQVPSVIRPRSKFNRDRYYKSTFDEGVLIPFYWDEVLPGDTFNLSVSAFARLSTLIVPIMDNLYMDFFFFYVPNRLVWENWERFCGEQDNPDDSTDYLIPQVNLTGGVQYSTLFDYFGLPLTSQTFTVSALPFRAYNLIWNEFFRDENLQDSVDAFTDDGPDPKASYNLLFRGKRKSDPFTSALPWPQKGPGVELPLAGSAPVFGDGTAMRFVNSGSQAFYPVANNTGTIGFRSYAQTQVNPDTQTTGASPSSVSGVFGLATPDDIGSSGTSGLYADLSRATSATINTLREAFQIQKWYEQLARGGSRYRELVLSMFGVNTGDARLQRPEYLGGGSTPIMIHSVVQTSASDIGGETPQGNLAAYGIAGTNGIGFTKSFVEHGHVIGLVSVRGDYGYQQGIDRMWSRRTKFDFYWPAFAHLGEVPVLNKEIYFQGTDADNEAFGYQERWYEYRYGINKITGALRSTFALTLDYWHLAQKFDSLPTLNSTFIKENPPVNRALAVTSQSHFIFDSVIHCRCARVMPVYSTPGLIDHF